MPEAKGAGLGGIEPPRARVATESRGLPWDGWGQA
jgi:hypothetical protein